jgi:hypothetical protein
MVTTPRVLGLGCRIVNGSDNSLPAEESKSYITATTGMDHNAYWQGVRNPDGFVGWELS